MTLAQDLGGYVAGIDSAGIPGRAREMAVHAVIDTVGVGLAGCSSPVGRGVLRYAERAEPAGATPVLGSTLQRSPAAAALVGGTLAHALDFDDCVAPMPGHPSAVVLPALLAAVHEDDARVTGAQFGDAFVVGIEVGTRIGQTFGMHHYHHGWHSTGTVALFSAVAAVGRIRRLDANTIAAALGLGTSMASGLQVQFGTSAKPLHTGLAARNAVVAVDLAISGVYPAADAFEGSSGYFEAFGDAAPDLTAVMSSLGQPFVLDDPGTHLKAFPCCNALHRPIDAVLGLMADNPFTADEIASVAVTYPTGGMRPLKDQYPTTGSQAKFHLGYALAAAMVDGSVELATFTDEAVGRAELKRVASVVQGVESDANLRPGEHDRPGSVGSRGFVDVVLAGRDGREVSRRVDVPPGAPGRAMTSAEVVAKYRACARFGDADPAWSEDLLEQLVALGECTDVSRLPIGRPMRSESSS